MTYLTPPELAKQLRVTPERVRAWIERGELRAVNVGDRSRARWRISADAVIAFEQGRAAIPAVKPTRKRRPPPEIIDFF